MRNLRDSWNGLFYQENILAMYEVKFDYFQASMSNSNFCN